MPLSSTQTSENLEAFKVKIIGHPHLKDAFARITQMIDEPAGVSVGALIGPTGAGKSTLLDRVRNFVLKQNEELMVGNTSLIPVLAIEAPSSELGTFNWRDLYIRMLVALKEPASDWQVALQERQPGKSGVTRLSSLSLTELRARVESAIRNRGVKVVLIDEAQHIGKMASGRRLMDQMDAMKSLASLSGAFVILFGTYELIRLLELNGQLARRCASIHLPRYRRDEPTEWRNFQTTIRSLEAEIRLPSALDLVRHAEMLYRGSAGCVGILKGWLTSAYNQALRSDKLAFTVDVLNGTRLPTSSLVKIAEEIREGEDHWAKSHSDNQELDRLLDLSSFTSKESDQAKRRPDILNRVPVGMRKPTRDSIGLETTLA